MVITITNYLGTPNAFRADNAANSINLNGNDINYFVLTRPCDDDREAVFVLNSVDWYL